MNQAQNWDSCTRQGEIRSLSSNEDKSHILLWFSRTDLLYHSSNWSVRMDLNGWLCGRLMAILWSNIRFHTSHFQAFSRALQKLLSISPEFNVQKDFLDRSRLWSTQSFYLQSSLLPCWNMLLLNLEKDMLQQFYTLSRLRDWKMWKEWLIYGGSICFSGVQDPRRAMSLSKTHPSKFRVLTRLNSQTTKNLRGT